MVVLQPEKLGPWTFADLLKLPESNMRCEILDGVLLMSPPPGYDHEYILARLRRVLVRSLGDEFLDFANIAVDVGSSYFIPDLTLVHATYGGGDTEKIEPAHVQLVVEAVSPSSHPADRLVKPAKYAAAGVRAFWRIETEDEISLAAYVLRDTTYVEIGTWREGETVRLAEPVEIEFALDELVPYPPAEENA